jgi:hypothetical protein
MGLMPSVAVIKRSVNSEPPMDDEARGRWLLAAGKHLAQFQQDMVSTQVWAVRRASQEADLLLRLRRLGTISHDKAIALARDVGIARQEALGFYKGLESTELISVEVRHNDIHTVTDQIFTEASVFRAVGARFEAHDPEPAERALIPMLDLFSSLPLREADAINRMVKAGHREEDVRRALELQRVFQLMRSKDLPDFGGKLLYNEYLWGHKIDKVAPVLAKLHGEDYQHLRALIDEIKTVQGMGIDRLTAAPRHLIDMAANVGIIDAVTIETLSGREQTFTFSPLFYGYRAGPAPADLLDTSDQVKLFVASIQYGVRYSEDFRLHSPIRFLDRLLREGVAGDATPIVRDYVLVERQGILAVEATSGTKGRFVLKKEDVVRMTRDVLANGGLLDSNVKPDARFLATQKGFRSPEVNRLQGLAKPTPRAEMVERDLVSAIRDDVQKGRW